MNYVPPYSITFTFRSSLCLEDFENPDKLLGPNELEAADRQRQEESIAGLRVASRSTVNHAKPEAVHLLVAPCI